MKIFIFIIIIIFYCLPDPFIHADTIFNNNIGNKLYLKGKYKEAAKEYLDAQKQDPGSSVIHYNLGNLYYKQNNYNKAVEEYNQSLYNAGKNQKEKTLYNLGNTYFKMNDFKQAIDHYKKALQINPYDQDAKYNIEIAQKRLQQNPQQNKENENKQKNNKEQKKDKKNDQQNNKNKEQDKKKDEAQQQQQNRSNKNKMSKEEAQLILDALKNDEEKLNKRIHRYRGQIRNTDKDW